MKMKTRDCVEESQSWNDERLNDLWKCQTSIAIFERLNTSDPNHTDDDLDDAENC